MLNSSAYRILSTSPIISLECSRFFLHLLADIDLRQYRVIELGEFAIPYRLTNKKVAAYIRMLVQSGVLEKGPSVRRSGRTKTQKPAFTYRIRPALWALPSDLEAGVKMREREELSLPPRHAQLTLPLGAVSCHAPDATPHNENSDREQSPGPQSPAPLPPPPSSTDDGASPCTLDKESEGSQGQLGECAETSLSHPSSLAGPEETVVTTSSLPAPAPSPIPAFWSELAIALGMEPSGR